MGAGDSKGGGGGGGGGKKHKGGPGPAMAPVAAVPLPPQQPYAGTPVQYHHMIMNATLDINTRLSFTQPNVSFNSTNLDSYYPMLASMYQQGYRMLVFVSLPGQTKSYGFASMGKSQVTAKFQGIFRRLFPEEMGQQWELKVEKSLLVNQMFIQWKGNMFLNAHTNTESATDSFHIVQTIDRITQQGGRLVSVELTGMAGQELEMQQQMMQRRAHFEYMRTGQMPKMQVSVDVFYELPIHQSSERYVYQLVSCPMQSSYQHSYPRGQFRSNIDWQGVMSQYLGTGWKLVEIFEDHSVSSMCQQQGFTANVPMPKNCLTGGLWIFEKPASRLEDNTPYYEGTMVEHYFKTKFEMHGMGFGGVDMNVSTDWEPVIEHMGNYGWQVVRILSTPDAIVSGTFNPSVSTRQLIFFQRKIAGRDEPQSGAGLGGAGKDQPAPGAAPPPMGFAPPAEPGAAPPAYDALYNNPEKQ